MYLNIWEWLRSSLHKYHLTVHIAYLNKHTRQQRFTVHNAKTGLYRLHFTANTLIHISTKYFKHHTHRFFDHRNGNIFIIHQRYAMNYMELQSWTVYLEIWAIKFRQKSCWWLHMMVNKFGWFWYHGKFMLEEQEKYFYFILSSF